MLFDKVKLYRLLGLSGQSEEESGEDRSELHDYEETGR
jgi:hypothetical protein